MRARHAAKGKLEPPASTDLQKKEHSMTRKKPALKPKPAHVIQHRSLGSCTIIGIFFTDAGSIVADCDVAGVRRTLSLDQRLTGPIADWMDWQIEISGLDETKRMEFTSKTAQAAVPFRIVTVGRVTRLLEDRDETTKGTA
jgi:hypothetical protein